MAIATEVSIEQLTVLQCLLESTYGTDPGSGYVTVPIYNAFNPIQHRQAYEVLSRAKDSLAQDGGFVREAMKALRFSTFLYQNGLIASAPWAQQLLPIAGFTKASPITGTEARTITAGTPAGTGSMTAATGWLYKITKSTDPTSSSFTKLYGPASAASTTTGAVSSKAYIPLTLSANAGGAGYHSQIWRTTDGGSTYYFLAEVSGSATTFKDATLDSALDYSRSLTGHGAANSANYWTPLNSNFPASTIYAYLNSHYQLAKGSRGNWEMSWEVGSPAEMVWDLMGLYSSADGQISGGGTANPDGACAGPGNPPKFENVSPFLIPNSLGGSTTSEDLAGVAISPLVMKSGSCTPGTQVAPRLDAGNSTAIRELSIHQTNQAMVKMVIEVDRDFGWDPIEDYNRKVQYAAGFTVGPDDGSSATLKRQKFSWGNLQQSAEPALGSVEQGIRTWELTFTPRNFSWTDGDGNTAADCTSWMTMMQY